MRKVTREEILTGNPLKVMFVLSFPVMISQFLHTLYHLADTFWLGHLPPAESGEAVAGLQISWPIIWFLIALSFGFGIAGVALVSQYTGAGEKRNANIVASQMLSLSIIFGLIVAVFGFILTPYLVPLVTKSATVTRTAITYMRLIFWGMALSNIIAAIVALYFYFQGGWKKQVINEYEETIQPVPFIPEEG